ncbi:MAG: thiamine pyrophosphate-dependent enzyme [bacterium]|nr:thiamine pyrophosphate-dependent enzyme [bacterium]
MSNCSCHPQPIQMKDYFSANLYTWCTNCGNYGIHAAVKRALVAESIAPCQTLLCFDVGCNGNGSDKIDGYRFHGLHGRIIPFASGAAIANRKVNVLAFAGDGATFGEGINHLIHAIRGNFNVTFIFHNNLNYGLTQGQASPTTQHGMKRTAAPDGVTSEPLHPLRLVLAVEPTFVARSFSGDVKHMTATIQAGLRHPGFSFIEIFQSCPTYNKETPHEWYQEHVYDISTVEKYDPSSIAQAREAAEDIEDKVAIGVLYQNKLRQPFMELQPNRHNLESELVDEVMSIDPSSFINSLR